MCNSPNVLQTMQLMQLNHHITTERNLFAYFHMPIQHCRRVPKGTTQYPRSCLKELAEVIEFIATSVSVCAPGLDQVLLGGETIKQEP